MTLDNNLAIVKLKWSLNFKRKTENVMRISYGKVEGVLQKNPNKIMMIGWGDKVSYQLINIINMPEIISASAYGRNHSSLSNHNGIIRTWQICLNFYR